MGLKWVFTRIANHNQQPPPMPRKSLLRYPARLDRWTILLCLFSGQIRADNSNIDKKLAELIGANSRSQKKAAITAVLKAAGNDAPALVKAFKRDTNFPQAHPGSHKKKFETKFTLIIPKKYSPDKSWPLVAAMPVTHNGQKEFVVPFTGLIGKEADRYIVFSPSTPGQPEHYTGMPW